MQIHISAEKLVLKLNLRVFDGPEIPLQLIVLSLAAEPSTVPAKQGQLRHPSPSCWKGYFGQREVRKFWLGSKGGRGNCILYFETAWSWNPQQQRLCWEPSLQSHLIACRQSAREAVHTHLPASRQSSALSMGAGFNIHIYKSTNINAASKNLGFFLLLSMLKIQTHSKKDKAL